MTAASCEYPRSLLPRDSWYAPKMLSQSKITHGCPHPRLTGANVPGMSGDHYGAWGENYEWRPLHGSLH